MTMTIQDLHDFRKEIDSCIQKAEGKVKIIPSVYGREMALVRTKLQEAKMWCGKCLEQAGSELPEQFRDKAVKYDENKPRFNQPVAEAHEGLEKNKGIK